MWQSMFLGAMVLGFSYIGMCIVISSVVGWLFDRRKDDHQQPPGTLVYIGPYMSAEELDAVDRLIRECRGRPPEKEVVS